MFPGHSDLILATTKKQRASKYLDAVGSIFRDQMNLLENADERLQIHPFHFVVKLKIFLAFFQPILRTYKSTYSLMEHHLQPRQENPYGRLSDS